MFICQLAWVGLLSGSGDGVESNIGKAWHRLSRLQTAKSLVKVLTSCYGLDWKVPSSKGSCVEVGSPTQQGSEVGFLGSDWIIWAVTSSGD